MWKADFAGSRRAEPMIVPSGGFEGFPLRILIVEDDWLLAMDLRAVLEQRGHEVVATAADLPEAIAAARRTSPDLALVDLNLRDGRTGPKISAAVTSGTNTSVIFVTANPEAIPADFAGAIGAIQKPWRQEVIDEILLFVRRYRNEPAATPPPSLILPSGRANGA